MMILLSIHCWVGAAETNTATNASARNDFENFKIIAQRNIFNPNRSGRGSRNSAAEAPKSVKTESFALVGTMLYDDTQLAFFDSSSSSYKKVVKAGESIAGHKVNAVTANGVKLEVNEKTLDLAVGQQMRRQDEGEWTVSGKAAVETSDTAGTSNTSGTSTSGGDEDEIVKRLMKKREEELNK